jgi:exonuclease SbcC
MLVSLKGFRSIQEYSCEFYPQSITLISGPSGVGKTTLMNAIDWCIYGSLKNVRKFGTKTGPCRVEIRIGDDENYIRLIRSKGPDSFTFEEHSNTDNTSTDPLILQDTEAQEKVNQLFSNRDVWMASCYLRQGTRNKFLESSPSDRLSFLNELCFSNQSPEVYLDKIEEKTKSFIKHFETENEFYKRNLELFQKKRKQYPRYKSDLLTDVQKQNLNEMIKSDKIKTLEKELSDTEKIESSIHSFSQMLLEWQKDFPEFQEYLLDEDSKRKIQKLIQQEPQSPKRINQQIESKIQILERENIVYQTNRERFENLKFNFLDYQSYCSIQISENNYIETQNKIKILENQYLENEKQKSNYELWKKELFIKTQEIQTIPSLENLQTNLYEIKLEEAKIAHELVSRIQSLEKEIDWNILDESIVPKQISEEEMKSTIELESKINERNDYLRDKGIPFDLSSVQKAILKRKNICNVQDLWIKLEELQSLEEQVNTLDEKIDSLGKKKQWINESDLPKRILELEASKNVLNCPKCSSAVIFENNCLIESNCHLTKDKSEQLEKLIEESKKRIEWMKSKEHLENEMNQKFEVFQLDLEKLNLSQEDIYQYPKLEKEDQQKLWLEINSLERYILLFENTFVPLVELQKSDSKFKNIVKKNKLDDLKSNLNQDHLIDISDLEKVIFENKMLLQKRLDLEKQIITIEDKLCSIQIINLDKEEIEKEKENLNDIQITLDKIKLAKEILELEQNLLKESENHYDKQIDVLKIELEEQMKSFENQRKDWLEAKEQWKKIQDAEKIDCLDKKYKELQKQLTRSSSEIKCEITEKREEAEISKSKLLQCEKAEEILQEKNRLEEQRNQVVLLSNRVSSISKLKQMANELEHRRMIGLLDTINEFTNEMLSILFDEPIKIDFSIYKMSKNKDKVKPSIVYKIFYKGFELDHIDQLSGGEADRVSLALTCSLFQFTKFPFLLLDEFASSLDLNTKEMAIQTLKTFLGIGTNQNKSILCISHDTVEGMYDYTVKF